MTYMGTAPHEPGASYGGNSQGQGWGRGGPRRCGARWTIFELLAMVLGFMVYWPIGLAVIVWKVWQKKTGYYGDLGSMMREKMAQAGGFARQWEGPFARGAGRASWGARQTGNSAFDEWRTAELNRLEEERRKLEAAERDFADYIANLRRARDREEFDRFTQARRADSTRPEAGPQA